MTSRHAHNDTAQDDTRWELGPVVGPADPQVRAVHSTPVPESDDLPPRLDRGVISLTEMAAPTVSFTVAPVPESVTEARHFALSRLDEWGMSDLADDVGLIVSELVTNALRHSGGTGSAAGPEAGAGAGPGCGTRPGAKPGAGAVAGSGFTIGNGPGGRRPGDAVHREGACGSTPYGEANAFGTGAYSDPADPLGSAPSTIRLRLVHNGPWLLCGILDASRSAPRRKEPDYIAETGRGLHLVESFSVQWGWRTLPHGKVVWALFRSRP